MTIVKYVGLILFINNHRVFYIKLIIHNDVIDNGD